MNRLIINILVYSILIFPFLISCIEEDDINSNYLNSSDVYVSNLKQDTTLINPENSYNPFDSVGINYTLFVENLWEIDSLFTSLHNIIAEVNDITNYQSPISLNQITSNSDLQTIQTILNFPEQSLSSTIEQSYLSYEAKTSLLNFIQYCHVNEMEDYIFLHSYILNYESVIVDDLNYSNEEKRAILSFSSYLRHVIHLKKRRDDKDWDISVASKTGALKGALLNQDATCYWGLILSFSDNYL